MKLTPHPSATQTKTKQYLYLTTNCQPTQPRNEQTIQPARTVLAFREARDLLFSIRIHDAPSVAVVGPLWPAVARIQTSDGPQLSWPMVAERRDKQGASHLPSCFLTQKFLAQNPHLIQIIALHNFKDEFEISEWLPSPADTAWPVKRKLNWPTSFAGATFVIHNM